MALRTMFQHAVTTVCTSIPVASTNSVRFSGQFVNSIKLLGRVGREPQKVGSNEAVTFPMYTENVVRLQDGTLKTYPCWHKVLIAKRDLGNFVVENLDRGQRCYVEGRVAYRAAETNAEGKMIYNHQAAIIVQRIIFLEKSRKRQAEQLQQQQEQEREQADDASISRN